jgi:hypothetical protein
VAKDEDEAGSATVAKEE